MVKNQKIPKINANDEFVYLGEWVKKKDTKVKKGDVICIVETTKAALEIEAKYSGFLHPLVNEGDEVKVNTPFVIFKESINENIKSLIKNSKKKKKEQGWTKKAEITAKKLGIEISEIKKEEKIREKDVKEYYDILKEKKRKLTIPEEKYVKWTGKINDSFLKNIESDEKFKKLGSTEKISHYRKNGALIGNNVKIGSGSIILSNYIEIEDDVTIGSDCFIKTDRIKIGRLCELGNKVNIVIRELILGSVLFTGDNILIGGGGSFSKRSKFQTGHNCLISSECIINASEPVILGNEVGLSPRVQIYTHSHWQNILEGYNPNFGPVKIGDHSYITGNCLVVPNVNIGKGATVLANSLVAGNVYDHETVVGVPAKKIKETNPDISKERKDGIMKKLIPELKELLEFKGFNSNQVRYVYKYMHSKETETKIILTFELGEKKELRNKTIFDLANYKVIGKQNQLSDEVRNFLRKRGIRFKPIYWRYAADEGFYNK